MGNCYTTYMNKRQLTPTDDSSQVLSWEIWLSQILRLLLLVSGIYQLIWGQHAYGLLILLVLALFVIPPMFVRKRIQHVPIELEIIVFLIVFFQYAIGEGSGLYDTVPYFDKVIHTFFPALMGLAGALIVYSLYYTEQLKITTKAAFIVIVLIALGIGAFWEIIEYTSDLILPQYVANYSPLQGNLVEDAHHDTMNDLIADTIGAVIGAIVGVVLIRRAQRGESGRLAKMSIEFTTITKKIPIGKKTPSYAPVFLRRALSLVIDMVILALIYSLITYFTNSLPDLIQAVQGSLLKFTLQTVDLLLSVLAAILQFIYFGYYWSRYHQSPGMRICRLKVTRRSSSQPLSFWRAGFRGTLGYVVSSIFYLGFIWAWFDKNHLAWHDKLFDTRVTSD